MNEINLDGIKNYFATKPIERVWIFGSYARGTQTQKSDLDLLVEFNPDAKIGLFAFSEIISELQEISKKEVDLVVEGTLYPWVEKSVEQEKVLIYERTHP